MPTPQLVAAELEAWKKAQAEAASQNGDGPEPQGAPPLHPLLLADLPRRRRRIEARKLGDSVPLPLPVCAVPEWWSPKNPYIVRSDIADLLQI